MIKRIAIIDGHPDPDPGRFCHALARAYAEGAHDRGHEIREIHLATTEFPVLRSREDWEKAEPIPSVKASQETIGWADHLVIIYPLWLGAMPALTKAFFEQVFRPGFAIGKGKRTLSPGLLKGKTARVVITMGMPGFVYRWFFQAHSLRSFRRNILYFVGIKPVRSTILGNIEGSAGSRANMLTQVRDLGRVGA